MPYRVGEFTGLQGAVPEPEQGLGPLGGEVQVLGVGEEPPVVDGGLVGGAGGERPLGVGQAQPQFRGQVGGASGGEFLVRGAQASGEEAQRGLGGRTLPDSSVEM